LEIRLSLWLFLLWIWSLGVRLLVKVVIVVLAVLTRLVVLVIVSVRLIVPLLVNLLFCVMKRTSYPNKSVVGLCRGVVSIEARRTSRDS
jgi:hypothetical protein